METTKLLTTHLQTTVMSTQSSLENPQHTGYFADDIGDGEAGRDHDNRQQTELEKWPKNNSAQRKGKKYDDWRMDYVDSIALLRQEPTKPAILVEKTAEECDRCQAHSDGEDGVPECIYSRLPLTVTQKFAAQTAKKCQQEQKDCRHQRYHKTDYTHRTGNSSEPVTRVCDDTNYKETEVLRQVGKSGEVEHGSANRDNHSYQVTNQRQHQNEDANT